MHKIFINLLSFFLVFIPLIAVAETISTQHTDIELISEYNTIKPGAMQYLGVRMKPEKNWHVYWQYQGDSGTPPKIKWQETKGIKFSEIEWPYPERIQVSHLMNYGYADEVLFLIPFTASEDLKIGQEVILSAKANWLVCKEECVPGQADLKISLSVKQESELSATAQKFEDSRKKLPLILDNLDLQAGVLSEDEFSLRLKPSEGLKRLGYGVKFIPDSSKQIENASEQKTIFEGNILNIVLKKSRSNPFPENLSGILVSETGWTSNHEQALKVKVAVSKTTPLSTQPNHLSVLTAIALAFVGGLILNLMPCVFPILSLKILSFVKKAGQDRKKVFMHSLIFALGVLVSFWILAGTLILLQNAGAQLGWGFQLQSPVFLAFMIVLLFLVALNLLGYYEVGAGLQNYAGKFSSSGYADSFLSGVLATLLATPCTAPFMGTAIAFSLSDSGLIAFLIFTFLAVGMALPYVLLSSSPRLLSWIPKPGPWMEKFKQALSFPVFATIAWLIGVYSKQVGVDYSNRILFSLVLAGLAIWILKNYSYYVRLIAAIILGFAIYIAVPRAVDLENQIAWEPFSNKALKEHVDRGEPVFIDFTAEWCLTCKLNKFVALDKEEVIQEFKDKKVVMMRADWTSIDAEITEALKGYGRSGVPVNVLYYGGENKSPYIFPSVLTSGIVLEQLEAIKTIYD